MNNSPAKPTEGAQGSANSKTPRTDHLCKGRGIPSIRQQELIDHARILEMEGVEIAALNVVVSKRFLEETDRLERQLAQSEERVAKLEGALTETNAELAELIKGEYDDPSTGINGWNGLHQRVEANRALLSSSKTN